HPEIDRVPHRCGAGPVRLHAAGLVAGRPVPQPSAPHVSAVGRRGQLLVNSTLDRARGFTPARQAKFSLTLPPAGYTRIAAKAAVKSGHALAAQTLVVLGRDRVHAGRHSGWLSPDSG